MTSATANRTSPVDQITIDHVLALANEIVDLNLAVRHLLASEIEDLPIPGEVLTAGIDQRLDQIITLLDSEEKDDTPLKAVEN